MAPPEAGLGIKLGHTQVFPQIQGEFLLLSVKEKVPRTFAFPRVEDVRNQRPLFLIFYKVTLNISGSEISRDRHSKKSPHISAKATDLSSCTEFVVVEEPF